VLRDLRLGYISEDAAREHYGLTLEGPDQELLTISSRKLS
jgi:hypothetical protein